MDEMTVADLLDEAAQEEVRQWRPSRAGERLEGVFAGLTGSDPRDVVGARVRFYPGRAVRVMQQDSSEVLVSLQPKKLLEEFRQRRPVEGDGVTVVYLGRKTKKDRSGAWPNFALSVRRKEKTR